MLLPSSRISEAKSVAELLIMASEYARLVGDDEEEFFDAREDLSTSGSCMENPGLPGFGYSVWMRNPDSIQERRRRFRMDMDLRSVDSSRRSSLDLEEFMDNSAVHVDGQAELESQTVLLNSVEDASGFSSDTILKEDAEDSRKDSDGGVSSSSTIGTAYHHVVMPNESPKYLEISPSLVRPFMGRSFSIGRDGRSVSRRKVGWLKKLGFVVCATSREQEEEDMMAPLSDGSLGRKANRVRVHQCGKESKEFSAVYKGQDIKAHEGAIWTMKFSPDGKYLATGGEDCIVRVWQVMESDFTAERDLPEEDPCCIYFTANHSFELDPMHKSKEKGLKSGVMGRTTDAACVILPPKIFQISEGPIHEFKGHRGEVLDLSWSKNKFLLSSSEDKSVRLWQVGHDECVGCFPHTDYVTCVQFNPIDENLFVSGSLDSKIRVWDATDCHVISWGDIKEMVTAVCYQPDGKGIVAGSMGGMCSFYQISDDNHLQLNERICLQSKKKHPSKRITGLQFCPGDPAKLMATSADSQVKILDGFDIVYKFKGLRNATSQISATFTSDGRHIVSASEDSNVQIWHQNIRAPPHKANRLRSSRSREHFFSHDVSVAIPWPIPDSKERPAMGPDVFSSRHEDPRDVRRYFESQNLCQTNVTGKTSCRFSLNQRFFTELLSRGSATWPEEKLPTIPAAASPKLSNSDYKFLKGCCEKALSSHAWGRVIVTAGLDGHIRSYCNYGLPVGC